MKTIPKLRRALYEDELIKYVKILKIPYFKGIYSRDSAALKRKPWRYETVIFNLDSELNEGTHNCIQYHIKGQPKFRYRYS